MAGLLKQRGHSLPAPAPVPRAVQEQVGGWLAARLTRGVGASPPARPQPKPRDQPRGHPAQEVTPARVAHVTPPARHLLLAASGPKSPASGAHQDHGSYQTSRRFRTKPRSTGSPASVAGSSSRSTDSSG